VRFRIWNSLGAQFRDQANFRSSPLAQAVLAEA
jgi:hypothetical protein